MHQFIATVYRRCREAKPFIIQHFGRSVPFDFRCRVDNVLKLQYFGRVERHLLVYSFFLPVCLKLHLRFVSFLIKILRYEWCYRDDMRCRTVVISA